MLIRGALANGLAFTGSTQVTYGKGLLINMQKLDLGHICQILLHRRMKIGRIAQLLVLNTVELISLGNSHVTFRMHA